MAKPELKPVTITVDGKAIQTHEGTMLVDAAKQGDIEIPFFCYEPKLGQPVGACRMCLVEIEGIGKLQTSCSTAVKDGMVVHTTTERVKAAQNSIVEFLLVNHPLDCPVCDKGGECPLQDITFGWGNGLSRVVEPKRHFQKPLALSPLVAIDRERCILCYRCVRFSQEVSEDWQLIFVDRGAHTFVGTHDGHPYVAPFSGNIIELCPVGALTSRPYRFRARPWDIEGAGGICTLCPAQCNVEFTVRDDKVVRVLARQNDGVDDGWLCDKGRFAYQAIDNDERLTTPLVRKDGELRPASWEEALNAAAGIAGYPASNAGLVGGQASNEEAFLLGRMLREGLQSTHGLESRLTPMPLDLQTALSHPSRQASVEDLEWADTIVLLGCEPVDDVSILDLRIRKAVRRHGAKLVIVGDRPSGLESVASAVVPSLDQAELSDDTVVVWHERIGAGAAQLLGLQAKLLQIPSGANGRGLREIGAVSDGFEPSGAKALYLFQFDPQREGVYEQAMADAELVIAHTTVLTAGLKTYADVVFPAESHAEKEGTVVHPDGRVQRLRAAIGHPGDVRAGWQVLAELSKRIGLDLGVLTAGMAFKQVVEGVPYYAGLTLEEIGGRGVRWPEREAAAAYPTVDPGAFSDGAGPVSPAPESYRSIWDAPEVEISPALRFLTHEVAK
jgi:NADH-quinone oxidoreductase subunit G